MAVIFTDAEIAALAERIARALPATIVGRPFASADQQAIYREFVRAFDPAKKFGETAAHEARVAWLVKVLGAREDDGGGTIKGG